MGPHRGVRSNVFACFRVERADCPNRRPRKRTWFGVRSSPLLSRRDNRRHAVTRPTGRRSIGCCPSAMPPATRKHGALSAPSHCDGRCHASQAALNPNEGRQARSITRSGSAVGRVRERRSRRVECREPGRPPLRARGCSIQSQTCTPATGGVSENLHLRAPAGARVADLVPNNPRHRESGADGGHTP